MDSEIEIPKWTPGHSPARDNENPNKTNEIVKMESFTSIDSFSVSNEGLFPFSITPIIPPPPRNNRSGDIENVVMNDEYTADGVSLTWEDLWVTATAGGKAKHILHGVTGYARPGEVLAIMGPSGCGKSTLLDTLAGRLSSNIRKSGEVLINGRRQKLAFGTSAYVTQDDILMTTLTVREAVYYSAHLQLPDTMTSAEKRFRAETTIKEMGLQDALNTRIGGWAVKGLSGGQKRRVSICMEILTRPKLLFLDEPTSGLETAYVTQDDILMTTLTVREAVYYSAHLQLPDTMTSAEKRFRAETTIKEMGLQDAVNTRIGGWAVKGLSGGQKRRVSICMEILTRPKLLFLDEPTSGLDSAASYHVMSRIVGLAKHDGRTVVASIHQPSSEVFELFHNLCLLSYGKTVYFGQRSFTNEFFAYNGFPCPSLTNPSDHYLRTINKDFENKDIERGQGANSISVEESINVLVNAYKSSGTFQDVKHKVAEMCKNEGAIVKKGSQASSFTQSLILTKRSFINMYRDLGYYWLRFAIYIALCLCVGTIYYDVGKSYGSIQSRGSMLMFITAFLTFMAIGGFPSFVEDMKIFQRERLNGHYGVTSFVIGNTLSSTPYLALISIIPGAMAYYLAGLQKSFDHFVYFALVLFTCMMLVESLMMIVASVVPDFLMGIITGAGIQGVMMLNGGFFRLPHDLPKPVWRYPMFYVAFHRYANQGFYKNEFIGLTFPNSDGNGTITGEEILRDVWQVNLSYSKWVDLAVLLGMVVLYRFLFLFIVKIKESLKTKMRGFMADPPKQAQSVMELPEQN